MKNLLTLGTHFYNENSRTTVVRIMKIILHLHEIYNCMDTDVTREERDIHYGHQLPIITGGRLVWVHNSCSVKQVNITLRPESWGVAKWASTPAITPSNCPGRTGTRMPSWGATNSAPSQSPIAQTHVMVFLASLKSVRKHAHYLLYFFLILLIYSSL